MTDLQQRSGAISPGENANVPYTRVESKAQKLTRAATRRKAKMLMQEQEKLLKPQPTAAIESKLEYKDPILFGGSTLPQSVQREATLSSHLLTTQHPEQEKPAPKFSESSSLFTQPIQNQVIHQTVQKQPSIDQGVEILPSWDKNVPLEPVQPDITEVHPQSTGLVPPIQQSTLPPVEETKSPVLVNLKTLEKQGALEHHHIKNNASTITEFDAESLPDEASLVSEYKEGAKPKESRVVSFKEDQVKVRNVPVEQPIQQSNAKTVNRASYVPKAKIQETYLNANIIPLSTPCYLTNVFSKLNLESRDGQLYLEKKTKKAKKLLNFLSKKLNKQLFVFRDNGHIESAVDSDYVLSYPNIPENFSPNSNALFPVFMSKKKSLMETSDDAIGQRWIIQESVLDRRYRYLACAQDTRLVLDKEPDGYRLVLRKKVEQGKECQSDRIPNGAESQMFSFKTYQTL